MEQEKTDRCLRYAESLSMLIQCDTVSVMGDVNPEKFRPFHALLKISFPHLFSVSEVEDFNGSLLIRWPGKTGERPILFMSHHDVVEAGNNWTHDPFGGEISDGKLWGRGTLDTKDTLWAVLQAADELAAEGFVPSRDIWFESACTEETDGSGADRITDELEKRGIRFAMAMDEGGYIMHDPIGGADHDFAAVGVAEKGFTDIKFIARSDGGHASTPGKNTPLVRLGKFMAEVERSSVFKPKLDDITSEFLLRCSRYMRGPLAFVFRHNKFFRPLLTRLMPSVSTTAGAMMQTTLAFTMASGSQGCNVLPQEAWVAANMRFSHHQGQKSSVDAVKKIAEKYDIETEILIPGIESPLSDYKSQEFALIEKGVSAVFGDVETVPYIMTGASDCRFLNRVCDNCFHFAPFFITQEQLESIHGADENVSVSCLADAVDFYKFVMKEI